MPMNIDNLRNNSKKARINFGSDGDLNVVYYHHRINQDLITRFQEANEDKDYDLAASVFHEVVTEWDLEQGDGEIVPMNGQSMRTVGAVIFNEIWDRLTDSITPKSRKQNKRS